MFILGVLGVCCFCSEAFTMGETPFPKATQAEQLTKTQLVEIQQAIAQARLGRVDAELLRHLPKCVVKTCEYIMNVVTRREQLEDEASRLGAPDNDDYKFLNACDQFFETGVVDTYTDISDYLNVVLLTPYSERTTKALLIMLLTCNSDSGIEQQKTLNCDAAGIAVLHSLINGELSQLRTELPMVKFNVRLADDHPVQPEHWNVLNGCNCSFCYGDNTLRSGDINFLKSAMLNQKLDNLTFSMKSFDNTDTKVAFAENFANTCFKLRVYDNKSTVNTTMGIRSLWDDVLQKLGREDSADLFARYGKSYGNDDVCVACDTYFRSNGIIVYLPPKDQFLENSSTDLEDTPVRTNSRGKSLVFRRGRKGINRLAPYSKPSSIKSDIKEIRFDDIIYSLEICPIVWTKPTQY